MTTATHDFALVGQYRVQGSLRPEPARLEGNWIPSRHGLIADADLNVAVMRHGRWRGRSLCSIRAADIHFRSGQFMSRPDILYKASQFRADEGTSAMPANIIDLKKSLTLWGRRMPVLEALFGISGLKEALRLIGDIDRAIANEYLLHEAGHCLGYSVEEKCSDGYFSPAGKPSAVLIAVEELRADAHGLELGLDTLSTDDALSVFVYYLLQRLGVHIEGMHRAHVAPYGLIPFLLFDAVHAAGLIVPSNSNEQWPTARALIECIRDLAAILDREVTEPEMSTGSAIDAAFFAGDYARRRLCDLKSVARFQHFVDTGLMRLRSHHN